MHRSEECHVLHCSQLLVLVTLMNIPVNEPRQLAIKEQANCFFLMKQTAKNLHAA